MKRPRILVITPDDPLRDRDGLSVYTRQMLHAVSRHAEVEVLCLKPSIGPPDVESIWADHCRHLDCTNNQFMARVRSTVFSKPSYTFEYRRQRIAESAEALIRRFGPEAVVFNHRRAAWLIHHIRIEDSVRRVYVCHNAEARSLETLAGLIRNPAARYLARRDARKTAVLENRVISECDGIICISREDASEMRLEERGIEYAIIPTWMPRRPDRAPENERPAQENAAPAPESDHTAQKNGDPPTILMAGSLNWLPKLKNAAWFSNDIVPRIRNSTPDVRLIVAGVQANRLRKHLRSSENIQIHDSPDTLDPFFAEASVFVIPERQEGGLKIKSVDAASRGLPIVSTSAGVSGSYLEHEESVLIADSVEEFAAAVLRVFQDQDLARRLGRSARMVAEKHFDRDVVEDLWIRHILSGA